MPAKTKTKSRTRPATRIVVVGAPAGGFEAMSELAAQLPEELPAVVFVVLHMAPPSPDLHTLVKGRSIMVTKGARENRYRPAIDLRSRPTPPSLPRRRARSIMSRSTTA